MRRIIAILLIFSSFGMNSHAKKKGSDTPSRMTFGVEWGYIASIRSGYHNIYYAPEGYRIDEHEKSFGYCSNGEMYIHFGYDISSVWNLSMYIGYEGITDIHKAVPVSLRMTRYFNHDSSKDRWFSYMDLGSGISLQKPVREILTGKIGVGYRLALSSRAALDFIISARHTRTHQKIFDSNVLISQDKISKDVAYISALSLGMALTF